MNKEEFMREYVLKRAGARHDGLDGRVAAQEAEKAWQEIQKTEVFYRKGE